MADKIRLLLACSDPETRELLANGLGDTEFETILAADFEESSRVLAQHLASMVFCEDRLPGGGFRRLLNEVKRSGTSTPVVILSRTGDWEEYLAALRLGAFDLVIPPYERVAIHTIAYNALNECRVSRGARDIEALPHLAPKSALRAAVQAAQSTAFAGPGGALHSSRNEYRPGRQQATDSLPDAKKNGVDEEARSSNNPLTNTEGEVPGGSSLPGNHGTASSVSRERAG